jgi:hypothetical protein
VKVKIKIAEIEQQYGMAIGKVIQKLNQEGQGISVIARTLDTNTPMIARQAAKHGITLAETPMSLRRTRSDVLAFVARIADEYDGQSPAEVIQGYTDDGYGPHVIAGLLGCCRKKVQILAEEAGITLNQRTAKHLQPHHQPTPEAIAAAAKANKKWDFDVDAAAKKIGISTKWMYRRLNKMPIEMALTLKRRDYSKVPKKLITTSHPWRASYERSQANTSIQPRTEGGSQP